MTTKAMLDHLVELGIVLHLGGHLYSSADRTLHFELRAGNLIREDDVPTDTLCFISLLRWLAEGRGDVDVEMQTGWPQEKVEPAYQSEVYLHSGSNHDGGPAKLPGLALYSAFIAARQSGDFEETD